MRLTGPLLKRWRLPSSTNQGKEGIMRIDKRYKLEKVTGGVRSCTVEPVLEGDHAIATDGTCMAVVPVERAGIDVDGPIPIDALKASRARNEGGLIALEKGAAVLGSGVSYPRDHGEFVEWRKVLPVNSVVPEYTISLNPAALAQLAAALGVAGRPAGVTLFFYGENSPIAVRPRISGESYGVIMPMRGNDGPEGDRKFGRAKHGF